MCKCRIDFKINEGLKECTIGDIMSYKDLGKEEAEHIVWVIQKSIDKFYAERGYHPVFLLIGKAELQKLLNYSQLNLYLEYRPKVDDLLNEFGAIGRYMGMEIKVVANNGKFIMVA